MSHSLINRATDLLPKYMWMGNWKANKLSKGTRSSRTASKRGRLYQAIPPAEGWKGGMPENNGLKARRG